ncbi:hypothetical protein FGG08_003560 [Glutinoglossum americanum]|uniref:Uncharacterized protein n=1 Tax=Glutinoglossum americanum TaxID=1670608 RepID=A0A9P8I6W9_9PEZI|nr:hypothetical protein FGG08_003560 [Glutinoglossum americanum]
MTSRIGLDDFMRALARTPRRSVRRRQRDKAELGLGSALEGGTLLTKAAGNESVSPEGQVSPRRITGPRAVGLTSIPDHKLQPDENNKIQDGDAYDQSASPSEEAHLGAISKLKHIASTYLGEKRSVGGGTECTVGKAQTDRRPRLAVGNDQFTLSRKRKGVVRKRRAPASELVLVSRTTDDSVLHCEPVDSDTPCDLIDDPIYGDSDLLTSSEANSQAQRPGLRSHRARKPLGILRNSATSKRRPHSYIDLSEFRMPASTTDRVYRARRRGSGFDGSASTKVSPTNMAWRYQKMQGTGGSIDVGELTLVNSEVLRILELDLGPDFTATEDKQAPVRPWVRNKGPQQTSAIPPASQPGLRGLYRVPRLPPTGDDGMDLVLSSSSPMRKPRRKVSFVEDSRTQFSPIKPHESSRKIATMAHSKGGTSQMTMFSFPPSAMKRRATFDQEIYEQFACVTAPARKKDSQLDEDTGDSSEKDSLDEEDGQDSDEGGSESQSPGEDEEEEELSAGQRATDIESTPVGLHFLGKALSQYPQPVGLPLVITSGWPKHDSQEPWRVTKPVRRTLIEVQDEILDDLPDQDNAQLSEVANARKRRRTASLPLSSCRQYSYPLPLPKKAALSSSLGTRGTPVQVSLEPSAAVSGKSLKPALIKSRVSSGSRPLASEN